MNLPTSNTLLVFILSIALGHMNAGGRQCVAALAQPQGSVPAAGREIHHSATVADPLCAFLKGSVRPNGLAVAGNSIWPPSGVCDISLEVSLFLISKADLQKVMSFIPEV